MKAKEMSEALNILGKYDPDEVALSFQPDEVYAGSLKEPDPTHIDQMEPGDVIKMGELGWEWEKIYTCWSHFT